MERNSELIEILNDLIRINHDRITGYEKAANEAKDIDVDLKTAFHKMASESRRYATELSADVVRLGGEPASGTTTAGKIYRGWMDVKATFTGSDRQSLLASCEFGEDAAQRAYESALSSTELQSQGDVYSLIATQKASLRISHDLVKKYRDLHKMTK